MSNILINPYSLAGLGSPILTDLVSWWTMDETGGTDDRMDSHGTMHLTAVNTPTSVAGKVNTATDFLDDNYESLYRADGLNYDLRGGRDFSIAGWYLSGSLFGSPPHDIVGSSKGSGSAGSDGVDYLIFLHGSLDKYAFKTAGASNAITLQTAIAPGGWDWIYAEYNAATNTMGFSVDNGTMQYQAGPTGGATAKNGAFAFGKYPSVNTGWADGTVDEWAFWSRLLSSDERSEIYNAGSGITYTDLL